MIFWFGWANMFQRVLFWLTGPVRAIAMKLNRPGIIIYVALGHSRPGKLVRVAVFLVKRPIYGPDAPVSH